MAEPTTTSFVEATDGTWTCVVTSKFILLTYTMNNRNSMIATPRENVKFVVEQLKAGKQVFMGAVDEGYAFDTVNGKIITEGYGTAVWNEMFGNCVRLNVLGQTVWTGNIGALENEYSAAATALLKVLDPDYTG